MSQDSINLQLSSREVTGKSVKHLRASGQVPAVIHDHGKESVIVQGDGVAMLKVFKQAGKHHPIQLKTDKKTYTAMIKTAEFEPRKHQLNHIVFNAVAANQKVEAEIPVHARYDEGNDASPAERAGLLVLTNAESVLVEALPNNLPDALFYDAEKLLEVGDHITVADLTVPEGVEVKTEPEHALATVYEPSALAAANDAAGGDADEDTVAEAEQGEGADETASDAEDQPGGQAQDEPKAE